jgi:DNA-binding NarL/FixJ family response regulator
MKETRTKKLARTEDRIKEILPLIISIKTNKNRTVIEHIENKLKDILHPNTSVSPLIRNRLSFSQVRIANLVKEGYTAKKIAKELSIATSTVNNHIARIRQKLGIINKKTGLKGFLNK